MPARAIRSLAPKTQAEEIDATLYVEMRRVGSLVYMRSGRMLYRPEMAAKSSSALSKGQEKKCESRVLATLDKEPLSHFSTGCNNTVVQRRKWHKYPPSLLKHISSTSVITGHTAARMGNTHSSNRGHRARSTTTKIKECFKGTSPLRHGAESIDGHEVYKSCGITAQTLHTVSRLPRSTKSSSQHYEAGLRRLSEDSPAPRKVLREVPDKRIVTQSWSSTTHTTTASTELEMPSTNDRQQRNSNRSCRVIKNQLYDPFSQTYESISTEYHNPSLTTSTRESLTTSGHDYHEYPNLIPSPLNISRHGQTSSSSHSLSDQHNAFIASEEIRTGIDEFLAEYYGDREPGYDQNGEDPQETPVVDTYVDFSDGSLDSLYRGRG